LGSGQASEVGPLVGDDVREQLLGHGEPIVFELSDERGQPIPLRLTRDGHRALRSLGGEMSDRHENSLCSLASIISDNSFSLITEQSEPKKTQQSEPKKQESNIRAGMRQGRNHSYIHSNIQPRRRKMEQ